MLQPPRHVVVATLGGQPQVVTLALDALLAQALPVSEVLIVHLSLANSRYQTAMSCLAQEFRGDRYAGRPCRYRAHPITLGEHPVDDLLSEAATDAALNTFHRLFQQLKQEGAIIHLCLSGGRRLLGMLALSTAMLYFDQSDRIWHLYSSDAVRARTAEGALMHLPEHPEVRLLRVQAPTLGYFFPWLRDAAGADARAAMARQASTLDAAERQRCQQVLDRLTSRQRAVLRAFAAGMNLQEVADHLAITTATVHTHKSAIFQECLAAWDLPADTRLDYRWLRDKFAAFCAGSVAVV